VADPEISKVPVVSRALSASVNRGRVGHGPQTKRNMKIVDEKLKVVFTKFTEVIFTEKVGYFHEYIILCLNLVI